MVPNRGFDSRATVGNGPPRPLLAAGGQLEIAIIRVTEHRELAAVGSLSWTSYSRSSTMSAKDNLRLENCGASTLLIFGKILLPMGVLCGVFS